MHGIRSESFCLFLWSASRRRFMKDRIHDFRNNKLCTTEKKKGVMCECLVTDLRERCVGRPFLAHIFEILPLPAYPRDILEKVCFRVRPLRRWTEPCYPREP